MLGFRPGFPYLLGLDPALAMPRRATPRARVPAGSVGIGGAQTGIYPDAAPGGWQLIGRTPLRLFDPARQPPARFAPGDRVRFVAIDAAQFAALERA
jgi:KipI family sensor histidine kinase inhibitor